jgi:hypothetical protein
MLKEGDCKTFNSIRFTRVSLHFPPPHRLSVSESSFPKDINLPPATSLLRSSGIAETRKVGASSLESVACTIHPSH